AADRADGGAGSPGRGDPALAGPPRPRPCRGAVRGASDRHAAGSRPLVLPLHRLVLPPGAGGPGRNGLGRAGGLLRRPHSGSAGARTCSNEIARPPASVSITAPIT